jgi:serine phosphatase RsbU (regulator of sigma subunit)
VVIYSDGVSEAERGSEQFGDQRLEAVLRDAGPRDANDLARHLEAEVATWLGEASNPDDLTLMVIHRCAG